MKLQADMEIAAKKNLWFKFILKATRTKVEELKLPQFEIITKSKKNGKIIGVIQQENELSLKIRSLFENNFCNKGGHPLLKGLDVDRCFDLYLFPFSDFPEDSQDPYDYDSDISYTEEE
jgi:hypothetical protein